MKNYSPKIKHFIGCGVLLIVITLSLIGFAGWSLYSILTQTPKGEEVVIPNELKETKVFRGEGFLSKTEIFKMSHLTPLELITKSLSILDEKEREQFTQRETAKRFFSFTDLKVCRNEIIAVGAFGGYVFDLSGNLHHELMFEPSESKVKIGWYEQKIFQPTLSNLRIVDSGNDEKCEFISFDSINGVTVFDSQGKAIWRYGERNSLNLLEEKTEAEREKEIYVTEATVADLNDDGKNEYIISKRNDGVHAFDLTKNEIWFQPDEFPTADFLTVDLDGDGKTELLEFQGQGSAIRDKQTGKVLKEIKIASGNKVLPSEKPKEKARFFEINDNRLRIFDMTGNVLSDTEAPLSEVKIPPVKVGSGNYSFSKDSENIYHPKAIWVTLEKGKPKYLAIIGAFSGLPRACFYLYDTKGNLVYHELLAENAETITALPKADGTEEVLVGGKDTIWKFTK